MWDSINKFIHSIIIKRAGDCAMNDDLALQEFIKGMQLFEETRTETVPIVNKILYNKLNGAIIQKITTEYTNTNSDLDLMTVDQTFIHDENLIKNFYVKDGQITKEPLQRFNYYKKQLELNQNGRFTTVKNNMMFVAEFGDTYEYTKN